MQTELFACVSSGHPFVVLPHADSAADPDHYLTTHQADYKPFTASQSASSSQANPV